MVMNYLAVLVASVVSYIIGWLWYSPMLFGNLWMKTMGIKKQDIDKSKKKGMGKMMLISFITTLITAFVLSYFLNLLNVNDVVGGVVIGFLAWLGFLATTDLGIVLWEGKSFSLYLIKTLQELVSLIIMGAILGVWV